MTRILQGLTSPHWWKGNLTWLAQMQTSKIRWEEFLPVGLRALNDKCMDIQVARQSTLEALLLAHDGQGQCTCQPRDTNMVLQSSQGHDLSCVLGA